MDKLRKYNILMTICFLIFLVMPSVLKKADRFLPIASIATLCLIVAIYLERSITFRIVKVMDKLQWINDRGVGLIYGLGWGLAICGGICFVWSILENIQQANIMPFLYIMLTPIFLEHRSIYVGENYIYTQGTYIKITDITSFEHREIRRGKHIDYIEIIISVQKKTYYLTLQKNMQKGIVTLLDKLGEKGEENEHIY